MSERPFVSEATASTIRKLARRGALTGARINPPPVLTLRRHTSAGPLQTVVTFTPVSIGMAARLEEEGQSNGEVTYVNTGSMRVEANLDIRRDDRMVFGGQTIVVTFVAPKTDIAGYRTVQFDLQGGA